jgi:predicted YcjX-like family ATPase
MVRAAISSIQLYAVSMASAPVGARVTARVRLEVQKRQRRSQAIYGTEMQEKKNEGLIPGRICMGILKN